MTWNRNSGYVGNRMSVRATAAYDDGALPLSKITAGWIREHGIGCTRAELLDLITEGVVGTGEWHHTGGFFAKTGFHRPEELRAQIAALTPDQIARARAAAKARRDAEKAGILHRDCTVRWIEWSGSTNRAKAKHCTAEHATVLVRGETATVTLANGNVITKRLSANGFRFTTAKERRDAERQENELRKEMHRVFAEKAKGHRFELHTPAGDWERITHREMRDRIERRMALDTAIRALTRIDRNPTFGIGDGMSYRLVATVKAQAVAA